MALVRKELGEPTRRDGSIAKQILKHLSPQDLTDSIKGLGVLYRAGELHTSHVDLRWLWSKKANALVPPFYIRCQQAYYRSLKQPAKSNPYGPEQPVSAIGNLVGPYLEKSNDRRR